jgi:hypothetical protein
MRCCHAQFRVLKQGQRRLRIAVVVVAPLAVSMVQRAMFVTALEPRA